MTAAAIAGDVSRSSGNQTATKEILVSAPNPNGTAGSHRTAAQVLKDIGLFFAAPWVTLAYLALFPFIGMKLMAQAWRQRKAAG
jgi:hypothetical protein